VRPEVYREINNFYTPTVYEKGAEIVRMLKTLLGADGFRKGMDLYFARHDGEAATVEQFIACFADATASDLAQFMRWYRQGGTPEVAVTLSHDAKTATCTLEIAQMLRPTPGQPVKELMVIPLAVGLVAADGRDLPLRLADGRTVERGVLVLTRPAETFTFTGITARPVASLNRGFSAPVKLTANLTGDDLRFLAAHDGDPFNRWQALQTLAATLLTDNVKAVRAGAPMRQDGALVATLGAILAEAELEPAFVAQALAVPSEADIARELGQDVDPDAIFTARTSLRAAIGTALAPALRHAYRRLADGGPYSPDAAGAGRRSLKNVALDLLAASGSSAAIALAARQYQAADNMTDRMAAIATLSLHPVRERQAAIDDFYRRFQSDPLVIDKWFALQAAIPEPTTLDRVRELTRHPAFSMRNPNRVRSLIWAFAFMNQTQFNRADGAGYAFVADSVLALDAMNPQVASRLMGTFKSWRALEPVRRAKAETELRRVAANASLSNDVRDIVERSLATT
jgi:aminopeptidase N